MKKSRPAPASRPPRTPSSQPARPTPAGASTPAARRIFLVDDHPLMRGGMAQLIESEPGYSVCGTAGSAEEALTAVAAARPDLVITDLTLPGKNGLELVKDLRSLRPELPVLVLSMHDELLHAERVLRAGARGYLMKEASSERLLEAIQRVFSGGIYVSDRLSARILASFSGQRPADPAQGGVESLSDREFEVFQLIGRGRTTREIADQLHLSPKTVDVHRGHIKEKLGFKHATELVRHAVRWVETQDHR